MLVNELFRPGLAQGEFDLDMLDEVGDCDSVKSSSLLLLLLLLLLL